MSRLMVRAAVHLGANAVGAWEPRWEPHGRTTLRFCGPPRHRARPQPRPRIDRTAPDAGTGIYGANPCHWTCALAWSTSARAKTLATISAQRDQEAAAQTP